MILIYINNIKKSKNIFFKKMVYFYFIFNKKKYIKKLISSQDMFRTF
jgi:hypothetical protein